MLRKGPVGYGAVGVGLQEFAKVLLNVVVSGVVAGNTLLLSIFRSSTLIISVFGMFDTNVFDADLKLLVRRVLLLSTTSTRFSTNESVKGPWGLHRSWEKLAFRNSKSSVTLLSADFVMLSFYEWP